jgi:hypothetical protein
MDFRDKQIAPPKSWVAFENLCLSLFREVWDDPLAKKHGRSGQAQHGVDIFGRPHGVGSEWVGVQCKGKEQGYGTKASLEELKSELAKAEEFTPNLTHWIFATTSPSDAPLQKACREITEQRLAAGKFGVDFISWDDIQGLLAEYPPVLRDFYPEHAFNIPAILERLEALPTSRTNLEGVSGIARRSAPCDDTREVWVQISFDEQRDMGPAIMGRPLGPADAGACPRIPEVDSLLNQLRTAYSTRLVGVPGAGKSICAYQVALQLAKEGWNVFRLRDANRDIPILAHHRDERPTLFLIDDAHLMPELVLRSAEEQTTSSAVLMSAHTVSEAAEHLRGAIAINTQRAVDTIARSLKSDRLAETYRLVHAADNAVGERAGDETIEMRIDHAAEKADFPWQFCFILGGGWRRSQGAADNARQANADVVLACAAVNQIGSGDASIRRTQLTAVLQAEGLQLPVIDRALDWLLSQRMLIGADDLRCPHQRFAAIVLKRILAGQTEATQKLIGRLIGQALSNEAYPMLGIRSLLSELAFSGEYARQWTWIVPQAALSVVNDRCWTAVSPTERSFACFVAAELVAYVPDWCTQVIAPNRSLLASWVSAPLDPSGYGLGHLLNHLRNAEKETLAEIVHLADPKSLAHAINTVTVDDCHSVAVLLGSISNQRSKDWGQAVSCVIDRDRLFRLADNGPDLSRLYALAKLCQSIEWYDEALALDLVEHSLGSIRKAFIENPTEAFADVDDLLMSTLRAWDPLRVFVGKWRPDARRLSLSRRICRGLDSARLAKQLSDVTKRDLQRAGFLLEFLHRVAPRKFESVVSGIDLDRLNSILGDEWKNFTHDAEVILHLIYVAKSGREKIRALIEKNAHRIERFPPRLVLMVPDVALRHVERGGTISLVNFAHVDWHFGPAVLAIFAERRQDLLENIVRPCEREIANSLSQPHPSWYQEAAKLLSVLLAVCPASMPRIIDLISAEKAKLGWQACLKDKAGARRTAALLIDAALKRDDAIGQLARDLRAEFPTSSAVQPRNP